MKTSMFAMMIVLGSLLSTVSYGQRQAPDPETRAKKMTEKMKTELSLTDDQYNKMYDINLKYAGKMQDLRKQEGDRQAKMTEMKEINKSRKEEYKAVLSEEQMTKLKEMQKDTRGKMRDHRKKA